LPQDPDVAEPAYGGIRGLIADVVRFCDASGRNHRVADEITGKHEAHSTDSFLTSTFEQLLTQA
jgi:hypothetical protein